MNRFLTNNDYLRTIKYEELQQITEGNDDLILAVEQTAQAEISSYLVQRYQMDKVFTATGSFDLSATYYGKNLIEYSAPQFSASTNYVTNDHVVYDGYIYASVSGSTGILPNTGLTQWNKITKDKTLYNAKLPYPEFSIKTNYVAGSQVWYGDVVYTALVDVIGVYPDANTAYWTPGTTYSFTGQYPENTTYWIKSDNRNQQLVQAVMDVTLYHLHSRINPRDIPELRVYRYSGNDSKMSGGVIGWLKQVGAGLVTADLPEIKPDDTNPNNSIQWGSQVRNNNYY